MHRRALFPAEVEGGNKTNSHSDIVKVKLLCLEKLTVWKKLINSIKIESLSVCLSVFFTSG